MTGLGGLLVSIAPLTVFAAVSPVIFLNASTVASTGGKASWARFAGGNLVVLLLLGTASMGLFGTSAESLAEQEGESRWVDVVLAGLLLGYGISLVLAHRRVHGRPAPDAPVIPQRGASHGTFMWGAVGMATNFTTLPLFVSVAQRIGLAQVTEPVKVLVLAGTISVVLTPAWLPAALLEIAPAHVEVGTAARRRVARWMSLASIGACLVGSAFLLWHAR